MRRDKGQAASIPQVILFGVVITVGVAILFIAAVSGGRVQESIEPRFDYGISEVKARSVLTSTLNGQMSGVSSLSSDKYGKISAKEVLSAYFSTNHVRVNEDRIPGPELKSDIKTYLGSRMDTYFGRNYYEIAVDTDSKSLSVESDEKLDGGAISYSIPLALTQGETAEVTLWLERAGGGN